MSRANERMLITGVSGLLGNNLAWYFEKKYDVLGLFHDHPVTIRGIRTDQCDLSDPDSVGKVIGTFNPHSVVHCASLTNVDQCEDDPEGTRKVNVLSTEILADALAGTGASLVYISTDSVYDGVKGSFHEDDPVHPLNVYGRTKYEGEQVVAGYPHSLVLRTNLFGWNIQDKQSLGEWILSELGSGRPIRGFRDAIFSTIYTMELARIIDLAIQKALAGIYNCGSSDACSKYEFALKIAQRFGLDMNRVQPISIDDFHFNARRGKDLSLNTGKLETALGYALPTVEQSIDEFYRDYKCGLHESMKKSCALKGTISELIPYGRQSIDESDIQEVVRVLRGDRITQGPKVEEFEQSLCGCCDARYAVAVNSGTSALHIACLAAGVQPGDEVITSPITFVASANCAVYCGARPVFADVDPLTYNISPEEILKRITGQTKAVIPVHFAGQSCDMESIREVVRDAELKHGKKIVIIEDACHALGSSYRGTKVGSGAYADMTVMSFHPVKHITTAEGGAVLAQDPSLYRKLKLLRSHGITSEPRELHNTDMAFQSRDLGEKNPWYYEQIDLGYNYRITDVQSALGISQLKKLDHFRERRRAIVDRYNDLFKGHERIRTPHETEKGSSNFHLYVLLFDFENMCMDRATLMMALRDKGIQTQVHYIPVHLQPFYRSHFGTTWGDCPNAENYYEKCLSIPLHTSLSDKDAARVVDEIMKLTGRSL